MLNERKKKILLAIIQSHIDLNIPIGSSLLTKRYPIGVSPATVRNIMSSLEKMGYIMQPHTSAGRVPTEKGYRFYVNMLLSQQKHTLSNNLYKKLSDKIQDSGQSGIDLIHKAAKTLSLLSHHMAVAIPPKTDELTLKQIKFIKYDRKKVLSVFIAEDGTVKNTFFELDRAFSQKQFDKASHYLNNRFSGLSLKKIKEQLAYQIYREQASYDILFRYLYNCFDNVYSFENSNFLLSAFSGTSYLPDFVEADKIKQILEAIEDKQFIMKLLNYLDGSSGIKVVVGLESIIPAMKELSMVVSTYNDSKNTCGAIGIIGPTRMNYKKLIPIVDHTARALTRLLST